MRTENTATGAAAHDHEDEDRNVNGQCNANIERRSLPGLKAPENHKLEELKLAFSLLAEKIQASSPRQNPNFSRNHLKFASTNQADHDTSSAQDGDRTKDKNDESVGTQTPIPTAYSPRGRRGNRPSPPGTLQPQHNGRKISMQDASVHPVSTGLSKPVKPPRTYDAAAAPVARHNGTIKTIANKADATNMSIVCIEDGGDVDAEALGRIRAAAYAEGRNAAETAACFAKQALKRVTTELEAERKSRAAAEGALRDTQRRAAESTLECERLARVVNSFGGRSLGGIAADLARLEKRVQKGDGALKEAQRVADAKAAEALAALERAGDLAEALSEEQTARIAAEDARKSLTQGLQVCLRRSSKAKEDAAASSRALRRSEAQRESLSQRMDVLRAANLRLEKRIAVSTGATTKSAGPGATEVEERLAAARLRLRTLSTEKIGSAIEVLKLRCGSGGVRSTGDASLRAAVERAVKVEETSKRWKEKLREAEAKRGEYKSAAQAAENGMQELLKEKVELEEVNRIMGQRLAVTLGEAPAESTEIMDHICGKAVSAVVACGSMGDAAKAAAVENMPSGVGADAEAHIVNSAPFGPPKRKCTVAELKPRDDVDSSSSDDRNPATGIDDIRKRSGATEGGAAAAASETDAKLSRAELSQAYGFVAPATAVAARFPRTANPDCVAEEMPPWTRSSARPYNIDAAAGGDISPSRRRPRPKPWDRSSSESGPSSAASTHKQPRSSAAGGGRGVLFSYPHERLLLESRRLREEVLWAVEAGPCHEYSNGTVNRPILTPSSLVPTVQRHDTSGGNEGGDGPDVRTSKLDSTVWSVPIDVLLRLCERRARGRWTRAGEYGRDLEEGSTEQGECAYSAVAGVEENRGESGIAFDALDDGVDTVGLDAERNTDRSTAQFPVGISADLAEQVRRAVSQGDEHRFLEIVAECGSSARGIIAKLLMSRESPT